MPHASRRPHTPRLGDSIRLHHDEIVAHWRPVILEGQARRLLAWLAECADRGSTGPAGLDLVDGTAGGVADDETPSPFGGAAGGGQIPVGDGGPALGEVVHELIELRDVLLRQCRDASSDPEELRTVHLGIDRLVALVVTKIHARVVREAQQAVRAREDMLAVVSHDLRNPLGAIDLSAAMLLQRVDGDARAKKQVETIRRSSERMEHMISDLLDMASIQAGRLALDRKAEDARALLEEVLDIHAPLAAEREIQIACRCDLTGVMLDCDRDRVSQVFGNLIGNALKFCRPGDTITIDANVEDGWVRFSIRDTGPGIAHRDLPHLFEPYFSAHRHAKQGTGLGLYICKGIIEAHGGQIRAESTYHHGAVFVFTLPVVR
jgi:signal transduction histidine kinase